MQFTRTPRQFAPLGGELRYAVGHEVPTTITIRIADAADGTLLGARRFVAVDSAAFDASPCIRPTLRYLPEPGPTGIRTAGDRTATVVVEAFAAGDEEPSARSEVRTFLPAAAKVEAPALLTAMPRERLIAAGEADELTLLTAEAQPVTVIARCGESTVAQSFALPGAGLHLFRIDTNDFPEAETIVVDAGACGTVRYDLALRPAGAVRLAWRSRAGSVEHYTFPIEVSATVEAAKRRAYGPEGHVAIASTEQRRVLRSAYERREVLEALAETISSPEVWLVGEEYEAVDVVSDRTAVHRHGSLSCLEIEIRPKSKTPQPWN
ncbi:MAG: hypothetical protein K2K30_04820 [Alistipes sp.]|nr:hypothetical protein [Alistipes sp.]